MTNFTDVEFVNKIVDRMERRQQLHASLSVASNGCLLGAVCELAPQNPACNNGGANIVFHCMPSATGGPFACLPSSGGSTYACALAPGSDFVCTWGKYGETQCQDDPQQSISCNSTDYTAKCAGVHAGVDDVFECGSFKCERRGDPKKGAFECKQGFGCNAKEFNCQAEKFVCGVNNKFECRGKHDCAHDKSGGEFKCGSASAGFDCINQKSADSFTCQSSAQFVCTAGNFDCPFFGGNYRCEGSVTCVGPGPMSPYVYPPPTPSGG